MLVHDLLAESARRFPAAIALVTAEGAVLYSDLERMSNRFAHLYLSVGVNRGDRVLVALENGVDMVAAYLGAMKAGAVAVPLPAGSRSDRLGPAIADCAPVACVTDAVTAEAPAQRERLATIPAVFVTSGPRRTASRTQPEIEGTRSLLSALERCPASPIEAGVTSGDLAAIIYTSGSTGEPRGVMLTHRNFVANATSIVQYLGLTAADRALCVLPFHYVYGLSLLHTHLMAGGSLVIENRVAFPNVVLSSMEEHEVTGFAGVPSTFAFLLHRSNLAEARLPHLRYVTQAGGAMPVARILEWLARGPRADFYVMYGATEAAARLSYLAPADLRRKLGSIGRAIPGVELHVLREDGGTAAPGEVGELVARGENISPGYWNRPDETSERFGSDGYRTGDLGYADSDGCLFLVGRLHDMIKVGANRVGLREIEDALHDHASVSEAAVVSAPDDLLGEVPVAFVTLRQPLPDAEPALRAFCAARLAPYKVPVRVAVLTELPKLTTGKIDKRTLREQAFSVRTDAPA
jgi:amino acid adenylation domain-containing protein